MAEQAALLKSTKYSELPPTCFVLTVLEKEYETFFVLDTPLCLSCTPGVPQKSKSICILCYNTIAFWGTYSNVSDRKVTTIIYRLTSGRK